MGAGWGVFRERTRKRRRHTSLIPLGFPLVGLTKYAAFFFFNTLFTWHPISWHFFQRFVIQVLEPTTKSFTLLFCPYQTGMQNLRLPVPLAAWLSGGSSPWLCVGPRPGGGGDGLLPPQRATAVVEGSKKGASKGHSPHTGENSLSECW